MKELDINNLIEKAQEFVHNGRLNNAAYGKIPLQEIELDSNTFDLSLVAEAKYDKTKPKPKEAGKYVVKVETSDGDTFTDVGYFDGISWGRVHNANEHRSADPYFSDYGQTVISWKPINKNW